MFNIQMEFDEPEQMLNKVKPVRIEQLKTEKQNNNMFKLYFELDGLLIDMQTATAKGDGITVTISHELANKIMDTIINFQTAVKEEIGKNTTY